MESSSKSFYFFDLDDNIFYLSSYVTMYHKVTNQPLRVSTSEISKIDSCKIHQSKFKDYEVRETSNGDDSFKRFRDHGLKIEAFEEDVSKAITKPGCDWQGPSWGAFAYAVGKNRPISIITARGHFKDTIKKGIKLFYKKGFISKEPNYLCIFTLNNKETRKKLTSEEDTSLAELKKLAVIESVEIAVQKYGTNVKHKFGVSDDNLKNMEQIYRGMKVMKEKYPQNEFYCFHMDGSEKVVRII